MDGKSDAHGLACIPTGGGGGRRATFPTQRESSSAEGQTARLVIGSLAWAPGLIATAGFFQGKPLENWIEGALSLIGILVFLMLTPHQTDWAR